MQFFSAKKILLLVDTYQRKSAGNAEKSYIQQRLQQLSLGTFKNCISTLSGFIINNIRRILLTIVATFFFIQIFAGAMTVLRKNPPIKHKQYSFNGRLEKISGLPNFSTSVLLYQPLAKTTGDGILRSTLPRVIPIPAEVKPRKNVKLEISDKRLDAGFRLLHAVCDDGRQRSTIRDRGDLAIAL